jgi:hypothetical protein
MPSKLSAQAIREGMLSTLRPKTWVLTPSNRRSSAWYEGIWLVQTGVQARGRKPGQHCSARDNCSGGLWFRDDFPGRNLGQSLLRSRPLLFSFYGGVARLMVSRNPRLCNLIVIPSEIFGNLCYFLEKEIHYSSTDAKLKFA